MKSTASEKETVVPHLLSEDYKHCSKGQVSWSITRTVGVDPQTDASRWAIYFDTRNHGPFQWQEYIGLIGTGDNFRYNRPGGLDPIHTHALIPAASADMDGDGRADLVGRMSYGSTWRQPWFTVLYWRNVGTNKKPVYADHVTLHADGKAIDNGYNGIALFDWNHDGRPDLVTKNAVYGNTGKTKPGGVPVLKKLTDIPKMPGRSFIGMYDHDGDGVSDAFCVYAKVHYIYEGPPLRNFETFGMDRIVNTAAAGKPPVFGKSERLVLGGEKQPEGKMPSGLSDVDGDGDLDVIGVDCPTTRNPHHARLCYWPNEAEKRKPPLYGKPRYLPNTADNYASDWVFGTDSEAYKGIFVTNMHRIWYLKREIFRDVAKTIHEKPPAKKILDQAYLDKAFIMVDRGPLMQYNARCGVDGYTGACVADWEGDGDWDLLGGDELGHVWLIRNISDNKRPVFAPATKIEAAARPIQVTRWELIPDGNPEYNLGQSKVRYVDWDNDGDFDLITANTTHRVIFFENVGTRPEPFFAAGEFVEVEGTPAPFGMRSSLATVDFNGDGLVDLVKTNSRGQACLFMRYREGDKLKLRPGKPFMQLKDGKGNSPLKTNSSIPDTSPIKGLLKGVEEVCDWDCDGDWDLLGNQGGWTKSGPVLCESVGNNAKPVFKAPVRLECWGTKIAISAHEKTMAAVDWYGTGKPDLICGGESGWFYFFRRPALDQPSPPKATMTKELEIRK